MNRLTVFVPREVRTQIFEQVLYISADSISNALEWEARLRAALDALSEFHGHAIGEDASERYGQTLRKTVFEGTYLIHYQVDEDAGVVIVANMRHGARLPRSDEP